jgi:hypothetical protein
MVVEKLIKHIEEQMNKGIKSRMSNENLDDNTKGYINGKLMAYSDILNKIKEFEEEGK